MGATRGVGRMVRSATATVQHAIRISLVGMTRGPTTAAVGATVGAFDRGTHRRLRGTLSTTDLQRELLSPHSRANDLRHGLGDRLILLFAAIWARHPRQRPDCQDGGGD